MSIAGTMFQAQRRVIAKFIENPDTMELKVRFLRLGSSVRLFRRFQTPKRGKKSASCYLL